MRDLNSILLEGEVRQVVRAEDESIRGLTVYNNRVGDLEAEPKHAPLVTVNLERFPQSTLRQLDRGVRVRIVGYLAAASKRRLYVKGEHIEIRPRPPFPVA